MGQKVKHYKFTTDIKKKTFVKKSTSSRIQNKSTELINADLKIGESEYFMPKSSKTKYSKIK